MDRPTSVPLHLTSLAILAPTNAPLFVHAFTGKDDELRAYHLAHAAVDVIEERIVMTASPSRPADSFLGLLFCMEDMAFYGFQTHTKLRLVLSLALVDAAIKDADVVAVFRAVHHLVLHAANNPFCSLPDSFRARHAVEEPVPEWIAQRIERGEGSRSRSSRAKAPEEESQLAVNEPVPESSMFATGPEDIRPETLAKSRAFTGGIARLGELLCARS